MPWFQDNKLIYFVIFKKFSKMVAIIDDYLNAIYGLYIIILDYNSSLYCSL
jgi:hypothetical protein